MANLKITLHGPGGQGTKGGLYYFDVYDKNGERVLASTGHDTRDTLLLNVQNFTRTFGGQAFDIEAADMGAEAPDRANVNRGHSIKTKIKAGRPTLTEGPPANQNGTNEKQ